MSNPTEVRDAKEFLIHCIVDEAQQEGAPLTSIERDMLYFTETGWTLPNIYEVNAAFEREYDTAEYEDKIAHLIRNLKKRMKREDPSLLEQWNRAVGILGSEDHYLNVMILAANDYRLDLPAPPGPKRMLSLIAIGLIAGVAAVLLTFAILFIARR